MKISGNISKLTDILTKMSPNMFAYFSASENSASFSLFIKKKPILVTARGLAPFRNYLVFLRLPLAQTTIFTLLTKKNYCLLLP